MRLADEIDLGDDPERDQARTLNDLAMEMAKEGKTKAAIVLLHRAAALGPSIPHPVANIGLLLYRDGQYRDAMRYMLRAVEMDPESAAYQGNLGVLASALGDSITARRALDAAIRLAPDDLGGRWDVSLLDLREGQWARGLDGYEVRIAHRGPKLYPGMPVPMWNGEDLTNKTLYVQAEQGVGDRILFSRYLAWVRKRWPSARILTCLGDGLTNLLWNFRDIGVELMPSGVPWPSGIDYGAFLVSLPRIHGSRPFSVPADPGLIARRIAQETDRCQVPQPSLRALKVGICWTGSPTMNRNVDRTIPLELMLTLAENPGVQLYSFQVGPGRRELHETGAVAAVADLAEDIEREGWVGTGLALREMDLIITSCTSVAHLAGAMGLPTWTLLCADPYWIWGRSGDKSVWYPEMTLFRQSTLGDWIPVIENVRRRLDVLVKGL